MAQYPEWMVYGGEVVDLQAEPPVSSAFVAKTGWLRDPDTFTLEGFYRTRKEAQDAWKAASWRTVDNALMRFFIVSCDWSYLPPINPDRMLVMTGKERRVWNKLREHRGLPPLPAEPTQFEIMAERTRNGGDA